MSYVGWRPVLGYENAEWVQMRSGAGESGWWHDHKDGKDFGGNPVDGDTCRTCGKQRPSPTKGAGQ